MEAVSKLEPLLKEADDYYTQEDYKDDKMAKGRALHPRLVAAWDAFASADKKLRGGVEAINDRRAAERLAAIEASEGRKARYHVEALMIHAKRVVRAQDTAKPDIAAITQALNDYESSVKALEALPADEAKTRRSARSSSATPSRSSPRAKQLMRRIRDKVPYSQGDRMMLNAGGGWMVEGSPPRLHARLQSADRGLQSRRRHLALQQEFLDKALIGLADVGDILEFVQMGNVVQRERQT